MTQVNQVTNVNTATPSAISPEWVRIDLADRSYDIVIGQNLLAQAATYAHLPKAAAALIITMSRAAPG